RRSGLPGGAPPEDPPGGQLGVADQLFHRPGLADPRVTGDDEKAGAAGARVAPPRGEHLQLALAADEQRIRLVAGADHGPASRTPNRGTAATEPGCPDNGAGAT